MAAPECPTECSRVMENRQRPLYRAARSEADIPLSTFCGLPEALQTWTPRIITARFTRRLGGGTHLANRIVLGDGPIASRCHCGFSAAIPADIIPIKVENSPSC